MENVVCQYFKIYNSKAILQFYADCGKLILLRKKIQRKRKSIGDISGAFYVTGPIVYRSFFMQNKKGEKNMFNSSIVSYGENGRDKRYGSSSYRGNTDGGIVKDFLDFCEIKFKGKVETCSDYMSGSFTTRDVCKERGIDGVWTDLSQGFNMLLDSCEIPDRPQTIFWHPPYSSMIGIPYAGKEWDDKEFERKYGYDPKPYDLGRMDWDKFVQAMNYCMMKMFCALETGGRMGVLMGDIRRKGVYKSMLLDIAKPGEVESIVIKKQNHTTSGNRTYGNGKLTFIPIEQEYFLILKKMMPYMLDFSYVKRQKLDARDSMSISWKDLLASVLEANSKDMTLAEIYGEIENYKKAQANPHWKDKVRQVLQQLQQTGVAKSVSRGVWAKAA